MSLWDRILDTINIGGASSSSDNYITSLRRDADSYAFVDVEVGVKNRKIQDIGALRHDGASFHRNSKADLLNFLSDIDFCVVITLCIMTQSFCLATRGSDGRLLTLCICRPCCSPNDPTIDL